MGRGGGVGDGEQEGDGREQQAESAPGRSFRLGEMPLLPGVERPRHRAVDLLQEAAAFALR